MKKVLLVTSGLCLVVFSLAIAYYFIIILPQKQKADLRLQNQIEELQQEVSEAKNGIKDVLNSANTNDIESSIDGLKDSIEQQNAEMEYENQRRGWCESGGGTYYGNGSCITPN